MLVRKATISRPSNRFSCSKQNATRSRKDLRPKHPKIIKLNDEISKQEKLIELFRSDAFEKLETRRKSIGKQMENLQGNIKEWEVKALDLSQRLAQFNRIKGKVDRTKLLYDRLTNDLKSVDVSQVIDTGDQISTSWSRRHLRFPFVRDY